MENDVRNLLERIRQSDLSYLEYSVPANLDTARRWKGLAALLDRLDDDADDLDWTLNFSGDA
jgi:hypothetical protein